MKISVSRIIYKTIGDTSLMMKIYERDVAHRPELAPAVVFFFGGGWTQGDIDQFKEQSRFLATLGLVTVCAEYRVRDRHRTTPFDALEDAKSAIRWLRKNAPDWNIDPGKIIAGGGSAGGHLAVSTAFVSGFDNPSDDLGISCRPDALVLFNPVVDTTELELCKERIGVRCREISPIHYVSANGPPTIIFHATGDKLVPIQDVERFLTKMKEVGNRCQIHKFEDLDHGFFNFGRHNNRPFEETMRDTEKFLVSLGYLTGQS